MHGASRKDLDYQINIVVVSDEGGKDPVDAVIIFSIYIYIYMKTSMTAAMRGGHSGNWDFCRFYAVEGGNTDLG